MTRRLLGAASAFALAALALAAPAPGGALSELPSPARLAAVRDYMWDAPFGWTNGAFVELLAGLERKAPVSDPRPAAAPSRPRPTPTPSPRPSP